MATALSVRFASRGAAVMSAEDYAMTDEDAAEIQSAVAKLHGGETPKDSIAARAQSAAAYNKKLYRTGGNVDEQDLITLKDVLNDPANDQHDSAGYNERQESLRAGTLAYTKDEAAELQFQEAQRHGGRVEKGSRAAQAQSEADKATRLVEATPATDAVTYQNKRASSAK